MNPSASKRRNRAASRWVSPTAQSSSSRSSTCATVSCAPGACVASSSATSSKFICGLSYGEITCPVAVPSTVPVAPMRRMRVNSSLVERVRGMRPITMSSAAYPVHGGLVLRLHEVHSPVLVAQLQERTVASRQYLSIHRIRLAAEHQAGAILRGPELDIGATCRGSQAQQYGFRISGRTVRHLEGRICG